MIERYISVNQHCLGFCFVCIVTMLSVFIVMTMGFYFSGKCHNSSLSTLIFTDTKKPYTLIQILNKMIKYTITLIKKKPSLVCDTSLFLVVCISGLQSALIIEWYRFLICISGPKHIAKIIIDDSNRNCSTHWNIYLSVQFLFNHFLRLWILMNQ